MLFYILKEKGNLKKAYKMHKASKKIKQLDLFDEKYYLKKYPSVRNARISPLNHYLYHGFKEKKQPGKLFDNNFYLKKYKDVRESGENPLVHYVLHGKKEGREANNQYDKIKKDLKNKNKILESYNKLFNYLFVFNNLERRGTLKDMQDACSELLRFIDMICRKNDITYWLEAGNLLGYTRHEGYIPWDDDLDIAMMREDYDKFLSIIDEEIKNYGLDDHIELKQYRVNSKGLVVGFLQIFYKIDADSMGILAGLDVFPYDYIKIEGCESAEDVKEEITPAFADVCKGFVANVEEKRLDKETLYSEYFERLNISYSKEDYIISGMDNFFRKAPKVHKTDDIFPLEKINFDSVETFAPNDIPKYLREHFNGDYMKIPKKVRFHDKRMYYLIDTYPDLDEIYKENIEKLNHISMNEDL